jgi:cobalamin biosynthesis protein CobT
MPSKRDKIAQVVANTFNAYRDTDASGAFSENLLTLGLKAIGFNPPEDPEHELKSMSELHKSFVRKENASNELTISLKAIVDKWVGEHSEYERFETSTETNITTEKFVRSLIDSHSDAFYGDVTEILMDASKRCTKIDVLSDHESNDDDSDETSDSDESEFECSDEQSADESQSSSSNEESADDDDDEGLEDDESVSESVTKAVKRASDEDVTDSLEDAKRLFKKAKSRAV